jgi:ring-1,2-phenylacetyl-CoA epoxidase subunit PaaC
VNSAVQHTPLQAQFEFVLRLADTALINGQRLSEWCGHGPFLEEDIGVANTALDLIGRARLLLTHAGNLQGQGRDEDALAFLRDAREWRNLLMVELPNGDFAFTAARQFLLDAWHVEQYGALRRSTDAQLAAIAGRAFKECSYHARHSGEWMVRLGDGTDQSRRRMQEALEALWPYTHELFEQDAADRLCVQTGIAPDSAPLRAGWDRHVDQVLRRATLDRPADGFTQTGGRCGVHTEHLGYLLAEMQFLQRAYPGLQW